MYHRYCEKKVTNALMDTPVVIISGPRQSGKTTLAKQIRKDDSVYITLDDITQYDAAKRDPTGFIRNLNTKCVIIDEVQRVPDLFLAIKQSVDENRIPGRYLLTGSSNALMLPTLSDSLAGRTEIINLLPLTVCEIGNIESTFLDKVFNGIAPTSKSTRVRKRLIKNIVSGGFAEPLAREDPQRRAAWYQQYINSIIRKDLKDLGRIEHISIMSKLVRLLAYQVGQLINYSEIASKLGISRQTVSHYVNLFEQLYTFEQLPAWHLNEAKRLVKTPKVHIVDTGLLCSLKRSTEKTIQEDNHLYGHLLESYAVNEIKRLATWWKDGVEFFYYRDKDKVEVDLILEGPDGDIVGIEIKASATVKSQQFQGIRKLQSLVGKKFVMGIVLYDGDHTTQHGDKLYSVPIGSLWE